MNDSSNLFTVQPVGTLSDVNYGLWFKVENATVVLSRDEAINLAAWLTAISEGADEIARMVREIQK